MIEIVGEGGISRDGEIIGYISRYPDMVIEYEPGKWDKRLTLLETAALLRRLSLPTLQGQLVRRLP